MKLKEQSCAVGSNLVNKRISFTPEEYFTLKKLKGLLTASEEQMVPHPGVVHRDLIKKFKNSGGEKERLTEFFLDHFSDATTEIFVNMHFSIFADKFREYGTLKVTFRCRSVEVP